jgi:hypothetical protein
MERYYVLICRGDADTPPEQLTVLDRIEVATPDAASLQKETALDHLEALTLAKGQEVMRHLLVRQWEHVDAQLAESHRELFSPLPGEEGRPSPDQGGQPAGDPPPASPGARTSRRRRARPPRK